MANAPARDRERISILSCRRHLGPLANALSDAQVESLRNQYYDIARVALDLHPMDRPMPFASALSSVPEEQRLEVEERAAILEFDGRLTRDQAERLALTMHCNGKVRRPA
jgi:hypothetical protein